MAATSRPSKRDFFDMVALVSAAVFLVAARGLGRPWDVSRFEVVSWWR